MTADPGTRKKSSKAFHEKLRDGGLTPSEYLLDVMRDDEADKDERLAIAKHLTQFELPRLNSIEADVRQTEISHEDWLDRLGADLTDEDLTEAGNENHDAEDHAKTDATGTDDAR